MANASVFRSVWLLQNLRASGPFLLVFGDSPPKPGKSKSTTRQPPALMTKRRFSKRRDELTQTDEPARQLVTLLAAQVLLSFQTRDGATMEKTK